MRMMLGTIVAATALVGCAPQDSVELQHRSQLETQTRGVALNHEGNLANVGMSGTTCDVVTSYAGIGEDYDYGSGDEVVLDGRTTSDNGDAFLVLTPGGAVHVTTPTFLPVQTDVVDRGVVDAALTDGGIVTVTPTTDNCDLAFHSFDGASQQLAALGVDCDETTQVVASAEGMAWVSTASGIFQVSQDGVTQVSTMAGAVIDYDDTAEVLYATELGSDTVVGLEAGGFERWTTQLNGSITALTSMGERGSAAVSLATSNAGEFVVIDGLTGQVTSDLPTPSSATGLDVSGNGKVLAITLPDRVYYFDVNTVE